jgi:hypothetical protein
LWQKIDIPVIIVAGIFDYVSHVKEHELLYKILKYSKNINKCIILKMKIDHEFHCVKSKKDSFKGLYQKNFVLTQ